MPRQLSRCVLLGCDQEICSEKDSSCHEVPTASRSYLARDFPANKVSASPVKLLSKIPFYSLITIKNLNKHQTSWPHINDPDLTTLGYAINAFVFSISSVLRKLPQNITPTCPNFLSSHPSLLLSPHFPQRSDVRAPRGCLEDHLDPDQHQHRRTLHGDPGHDRVAEFYDPAENSLCGHSLLGFLPVFLRDVRVHGGSGNEGTNQEGWAWLLCPNWLETLVGGAGVE